MIIYRTIILFCLISFISCKTTIKDRVIKDIEKNSILVLNDTYVLLEPLKFIERIDNSSILEVEIVSVDSINYKSSYESLVRIITDSTIQDIFNETKWIEYRFI